MNVRTLTRFLKLKGLPKRSLGEREECVGKAAEPVLRSQHEVLSQENAAITEQLIDQTKPNQESRIPRYSPSQKKERLCENEREVEGSVCLSWPGVEGIWRRF
jgi:hypothetical protein